MWDNAVMEPGPLKQLQISVLPEGESIYYNKIEWTSSDESIVEVDSNGCLSSKDKKGNAEVTVTMYGFGTKLYAQKTITVTVEKPNPVQKINMQKNLLMKKGDTHTLQAEILPADADSQKIIWTSRMKMLLLCMRMAVFQQLQMEPVPLLPPSIM